jgi:hypothetical protein
VPSANRTWPVAAPPEDASRSSNEPTGSTAIPI